METIEQLRSYLDEKRIKLVVCGDGRDRGRFRKMVNSKRLDDVVKYLGRVSEKQKMKLIDNCLFAVSPSRFESFCITAVEIQTRGKTIIATSRGGLKETVINGKTGILIDELNSHVLAKAIKILIENKQYREELEKNTKEHSKKFNWTEAAEKEWEIYRRWEK